MLTSCGGQGELLSSGMKFVNAFIESADTIQKRLYIQAELEQAGFDITAIKKVRYKIAGETQITFILNAQNIIINFTES